MIRIRNSDEFRRLLDALAQDVGDANIHWRLYRDLIEEHKRYKHVWNQSRTFWYLTLNAHSFTAFQCLARAYDQNDSSLHLLSWLKTIQQNLHLFEREAFKVRMTDNPFVESLADSPRVPDAAQLASDIQLCSDSDPKVHALILHRNNLSAHRNARMTAQGRSIVAEFGMSVDDFEMLLDRAHEIVNRYSSLFAASTYSRKIIGNDDYGYIFSSVEEAVEKAHKSMEEMIASSQQPPKD